MTASAGGPDAAVTARMQAAAEWLQYLDDIELSDEQVVAWLDWYNSSEENRRVFDDMQAIYLSCKNLRPEHRRILIDALEPAPSERWRSWAWARALGLVLLAAALGGWWWCLQSR